MAKGSEAVSFKKYAVKAVCSGCGRKLVKAHEPAMWFQGHPFRAVYGPCCWSIAAHITEERKAA